MKNLKIGAVAQSCFDPGAQAKKLERLGFDYVAAGEHVSFGVPIGNTFISLAAAAGATEKIGLISAITQAPLYPAALLAKMCAALDVASNGRFSLGVGVAGENPAEFEACGVPVNERGARTDEALQILNLLMSGESISFSGKFNQLTDIAINPAPIQKPLPLWVSGRQEAAMIRAARYGTGWLPYMFTPRMLADSLETIRRERDSALPEIDGGIFAWGYVHEDSRTAREVAIAHLTQNYRQDFSKLVDKYCFAGNPQQVVQRLREFAEAGATTIVACFACPEGGQSAAYDLFAREVLPALRVAQ